MIDAKDTVATDTGEAVIPICADVEATAIGTGWHGWMHFRVDTPPSQEDYQPRAWQKPHQQNLTGTALAYRPKGSLLNTAERPRVTGDYDAWQPE